MQVDFVITAGKRGPGLSTVFHLLEGFPEIHRKGDLEDANSLDIVQSINDTIIDKMPLKGPWIRLCTSMDEIMQQKEVYCIDNLMRQYDDCTFQYEQEDRQTPY